MEGPTSPWDSPFARHMEECDDCGGKFIAEWAKRMGAGDGNVNAPAPVELLCYRGRVLRPTDSATDGAKGGAR